MSERQRAAEAPAYQAAVRGPPRSAGAARGALATLQRMADRSPVVQGRRALQRLAEDKARRSPGRAGRGGFEARPELPTGHAAVRPKPVSGGAAPVQCYGHTPDRSWRISDSDKSGVPQDQDEGGNTFYATPDIIKDGDAKLLAAQSAIGLDQTDETAEVEGNTLHSVAPYLRDQAVEETDHERTKKLKDINSGDKEDDDGVTEDGILAMWTDCGKAARTIMGVQDTGTNPKVTTNIGDSRRSSSPSAYSEEMYPKAIKAFFGDEASESFLKEGVHYTKVGQVITMVEPTDAAHAKRMYSALGEDGREAFDAHVGINRYANPEIGDAYNMVTEKQMPGFSKQSGRTWNFHWAGVIAKDGGDNITLEGYAISAAEEIRKAKQTLSGEALNKEIERLKKWAADYVDRDWVFQMYGTDPGETFHDDHLKSGTHGNRATTFHVKK
jgi:hypothetical protein